MVFQIQHGVQKLQYVFEDKSQQLLHIPPLSNLAHRTPNTVS